MTEPQVWTLIGVFAALMFGMLGVVSGTFVRVLRAEVGRIDAKFDALDAKFDALDAKVDARIMALDAKMTARFEVLDRDIQAIADRVFPEKE